METTDIFYYKDIMFLGFKEEFCSDKVFFDQHGYEYSIITLNLTKLIYLDWEKETKHIFLYRIDSVKHCNVVKKVQITTWDQLNSIIDFFINDVV